MSAFELPESVRIGRELARVIARERAAGTPTKLSDVRPYYRSRFSAGVLPQNLERDLGWAEAHPEIFKPLLKADILPLDAKPMHPDMLTIAEFFSRYEGRVRPAQWTGYVKAGIDHLIYCASPVEFRSSEEYENRVRLTRPDLVPCLRPTSKGELLKKVNTLHQERRRQAANSECSKDLPCFMASPGVFINYYPAGKDKTAEYEYFYRVVWQKFSAVEEALDYFLNNGEKSQFARNRTPISLFRLARELKGRRNHYTTMLREQQQYAGYANDSPVQFLRFLPD